MDAQRSAPRLVSSLGPMIDGLYRSRPQASLFMPDAHIAVGSPSSEHLTDHAPILGRRSALPDVVSSPSSPTRSERWAMLVAVDRGAAANEFVLSAFSQSILADVRALRSAVATQHAPQRQITISCAAGVELAWTGLADAHQAFIAPPKIVLTARGSSVRQTVGARAVRRTLGLTLEHASQAEIASVRLTVAKRLTAIGAVLLSLANSRRGVRRVAAACHPAHRVGTARTACAARAGKPWLPCLAANHGGAAGEILASGRAGLAHRRRSFVDARPASVARRRPTFVYRRRLLDAAGG